MSKNILQTYLKYFLFFILIHLSLSAQSAEPEASPALTGNNITGDLKEIKERGTLRIIVPENIDGGRFLPRNGSPVWQQKITAQNFARSLGLKLEVVPVLSFHHMIPTLLAGKGDIIVANLTVTDERKRKIAFSAPLEHVHEVVITSKENGDIKSAADLSGKNLVLDPSSSFWATGNKLRAKDPSIRLHRQPGNLLDEEVLDLVAEGKYDASIRDSNVAQMYLRYRHDLKQAFKIKGEQAIAWGLRHNSSQLKAALDKYITSIKLEATHNERAYGDLNFIKKRGVLRVLLKNNASSYFLWKGKLQGFEYEMAKAYADSLGVKLAVVVPPSNNLMLQWLRQGKADFAAGFLTPTEKWKQLNITPSVEYHKSFYHVVTNSKKQSLQYPTQLAGHTLFVHRSSNYWSELEKLQKSGIDLILKPAPENMEVEEILENVAKGKFEMTLVDKHLLDIGTASGTRVKSVLTVGRPHSHTLAIREGNDALLQDLNRYIQKNRNSPLYTRLYKKYFTNKQKIREVQNTRLKVINGEKRISSYDKIVKKYAKKYNLDWRMIMAQMFQESRFKANAVSSAGARGLMQVMPSTGRQLGFSQLHNPESSIHAGIKYMSIIYKKFSDELPVADRMWFSLASYNAGYGHVYDARRLAAQLGLNKNRWFDNVEKAMLLLAKPQYSRKARYGYVRGKEPVTYVKNIKKYFETYLNIVQR